MSNYKYYGFETLGQHTTDFGLFCVDHSIGFPTKKKTLVQVPFSNDIYDFSNVYGGQTFTTRPLSFKFLFYGKEKDDMYRVWTKVANWLMSGYTKLPLYDDKMKRYYYLAEVSEIQDFEDAFDEGYLTIDFECYPFRVYQLKEGNDIWDSFDFELDIAQTTTFNISGKQEVTLYNLGVSSIKPTIKTSSPMTIVQGSNQFEVPQGVSSSTRFRLLSGENRFSIQGNGSISFEWYKELI